MTNDIRLENVTLDFRAPGDKGSLTILDRFSITIERESFTILLGPSGCGKSTLLNLINGLIAPTSADAIEVFGQDIRRNADVTRQVAYVFQNPRLLPWKTLRENVLFGLRGLRVQPKERWANLTDGYLEMVGLGNFRDYYPHQVSGGMQQRASIVRAWVNEPRILLMDEPFSHLDEITASKLRSELIQLWSRESPRRTIVFVTHDIGEAVELGQRIIMLSNRPARVFHDESIAQTWPRETSDDHLFEVEKRVRRIFFENVMSGADGPTA